MILSNFSSYVKQLWKNAPDTSTPLSADRMTHMEDGIKANSDFIKEIVDSVVDTIVNDPDKIASMAALYSVDKKIGDTSKLPSGSSDVASAISTLYSNLPHIKIASYTVSCGIPQSGTTMPFKTQTGLDLTTQADYPKDCKLIVPLCAYNGDKFAVIGLTSNRYLNLNGDNLTYTCVVAYLC